jgi:hypothetical protein
MARTKQEIEMDKKILRDISKMVKPGRIELREGRSLINSACEMIAITGNKHLERATATKSALFTSSIPDSWAEELILDVVRRDAQHFYVICRVPKIP